MTINGSNKNGRCHWGSSPCPGFITLDEHLEALDEFKIRWQVTRAPA